MNMQPNFVAKNTTEKAQNWDIYIFLYYEGISNYIKQILSFSLKFRNGRFQKLCQWQVIVKLVKSWWIRAKEEQK